MTDSASTRQSEHIASADMRQDLPVAIAHGIPALSQAIETLYKDRLGHPPSQVSCNLVATRLVVWIEGSVTAVEKLLLKEDNSQTHSLCRAVDQLMYEQVVSLIEQHLKLKVLTQVSGTCYESNCTGIIVQL